MAKYIPGNNLQLFYELIMKQASLWKQNKLTGENLKAPHGPPLYCSAVITITCCLSYSVNSHLARAMQGKLGIPRSLTVSRLPIVWALPSA